MSRGTLSITERNLDSHSRVDFVRFTLNFMPRHKPSALRGAVTSAQKDFISAGFQLSQANCLAHQVMVAITAFPHE